MREKHEGRICRLILLRPFRYDIFFPKAAYDCFGLIGRGVYIVLTMDIVQQAMRTSVLILMIGN